MPFRNILKQTTQGKWSITGYTLHFCVCCDIFFTKMYQFSCVQRSDDWEFCWVYMCRCMTESHPWMKMKSPFVAGDAAPLWESFSIICFRLPLTQSRHLKVSSVSSPCYMQRTCQPMCTGCSVSKCFCLFIMKVCRIY